MLQRMLKNFKGKLLWLLNLVNLRHLVTPLITPLGPRGVRLPNGDRIGGANSVNRTLANHPEGVLRVGVVSKIKLTIILLLRQGFVHLDC
jgi:hypothetical protein